MNKETMSFKARILSYGCSSSAGSTASEFWESLVQQKRITNGKFKSAPASNSLDTLVTELLRAWKEAKTKLDHSQISIEKRLGVIFASTKGNIDDYVWDAAQASNSSPQEDTLTPVLKHFLLRAELSPILMTSVSNACASSLAALFLGQEWLKQGRVDQVILIAADQAGPFVKEGFQALQALTASEPQPFADCRDGLALGEAAAVIVLGKNSTVGFSLEGVALDTEGYAVTRPSPSGKSLMRAYRSMKSAQAPDVIIAHGTATKINDSAEDQTYSELFPSHTIPITGTKWCIGHTLGVSGAMDVIAACEILKHQKVFPIATTQTIDSAFKNRYITGNEPLSLPVKKVLIASLGFGGTHATVEVGQ